MAWIKIIGMQGPEKSLEILKSLFPDDDPFVAYNFSETHKAVLGIGAKKLESQLSEITRVNDPDSFGITALSWAARRGDDRSLIQLLARGADPNICDIWDMAPVHFASNLSDPNSVQQLVYYRANVNKTDRWCRNAFHYMTKTCSNPAFFEPFIRAGIEINHLEHWGKPALNVAAVFNNHQIVKYLLDNGAEMTYFDADDDSVIFEAVHHNSHEVLKILLQENADVTTVNRWGQTILHMAAIYGDGTTMNILNDIELSENCLAIRNTGGLTPAEAFDKREGRPENLDEAFQRLRMSQTRNFECEREQAKGNGPENQLGVTRPVSSHLRCHLLPLLLLLLMASLVFFHFHPLLYSFLTHPILCI
jgi:ankyrin repeat protein